MNFKNGGTTDFDYIILFLVTTYVAYISFSMGNTNYSLSVMAGDQNTRTENYKSFLVALLREKRVVKVLDAACGTGVDSVMLLEEVSTN